MPRKTLTSNLLKTGAAVGVAVVCAAIAVYSWNRYDFSNNPDKIGSVLTNYGNEETLGRKAVKFPEYLAALRTQENLKRN